MDERASRKFPIARRLISSPALGSAGTTVTSTTFSLNGRIKAILHNAEDLTGATFNMEILDKDSVAIYTQNTISDNQKTYTNLTQNAIFFLSGDNYTIKWTITSQTLDANELQALLFLK